MTWGAYGDFRAPFDGYAFSMYAMNAHERHAESAVFRTLVTKQMRLNASGMFVDTDYWDVLHTPSRPEFEETPEEMLARAGVEVTHEPDGADD